MQIKWYQHISQIKQHYLKIFLLSFFFFPSISHGTLSVTTSTIDSNTIRVQISASTFAEIIDDVADCGGSGASGSWALILHKAGTDYQSSIAIQGKDILSIDQNITLADNGTYKLGIIFGGLATNWSNLYNVTSCATAGGSPFSGTVNNYKQITIPLSLPPTTYYSTFMSSSTDIAVNYFFIHAQYMLDLLGIIIVASFVYWFYNKTK